MFRKSKLQLKEGSVGKGLTPSLTTSIKPWDPHDARREPSHTHRLNKLGGESKLKYTRILFIQSKKYIQMCTYSSYLLALITFRGKSEEWRLRKGMDFQFSSLLCSTEFIVCIYFMLDCACMSVCVSSFT